MEEIIAALSAIRAPIMQGEYDLHSIVSSALTGQGISFSHEVNLGCRCRIDFLAGEIGIEVKRGKVERSRVASQIQRYMQWDSVKGIILVSEHNVDLPQEICGKPVRQVCLNKLWGIAL